MTVRNSCTSTITIQICIRRASGTCDCGQRDVGAGGTMNQYSCDTNNTYRTLGRATTDFGHTGCFPTSC